MSNTFLYIAWGVLYAVCAGLGFIPSPDGVALGLMILFCLLFFLPPVILLRRAIQENNRKTLVLIRNLSLIWLITATVLLVLNILSVMFSALAGQVLYYFLILLTSPMICGQYWVLSLFLWACLLIVSWQQLRKIKE